MKFYVPSPLRTIDLLVLQCLAALGGMSRELVCNDEGMSDGLFSGTDHRLLVRTKISSLLKELGRSTGSKNYTAVRDSIERLGAVTIHVTIGSRSKNYFLIRYEIDTADDQDWIVVSLNPALTDAIQMKRKYAYLNLAEVRMLSGEKAPLIYQRLCGYIDPGKSSVVALDTICSYIWPELTDIEPTRTQRSEARQALEQFSLIGWTVRQYAKNKYSFERPAIGSTS